MSTFVGILVRSCAASSNFSGRRSIFTSTIYFVNKVEYDSTKVFLDKAKEHLSTGDVAQCCEKLFGSVKFALRTYVEELGKLHSMPTIAPETWSYAKYRKLCVVISKSLKKPTFITGWREAEQLHMLGWNLNEIDYEDAELGLKNVEDFLHEIAKLTKEKEIATSIYTQIFKFDEVFIAKKISKLIENGNYEQALLCFGVKLEYNYQQREKIINAYNNIYKSDLRKKLNVFF